MAVEGLIGLTLLTGKGVTTTKPLISLVITNALALVGGTTAGGMVGYQVKKRFQNQEKEQLREELGQAKSQVEEASGLREQLAIAQARISQLLKGSAEAAAPEAPAERAIAIADDLQNITGIGQVFAGRLNEAGISTFADLASANPAEVREIVSSGRVENMIDPEEWIAQARQLAGESED